MPQTLTEGPFPMETTYTWTVAGHRSAESHAKAILAPEHDAHPDLPVICPRLNIGGRRVRTISTVMRFDTAVEVTASELRVELMFPADDESEAFFHEVGRP